MSYISIYEKKINDIKQLNISYSELMEYSLLVILFISIYLMIIIQKN